MRQEHVFAARVAGINSCGVLRCVPAIYSGVVLHAGIAAVPGGFGNFLKQAFGFVGLHDVAVADCFGGEIGVADYGVHEVVGDADGVVGVLKKDGRISVGIGMGPVVSQGDQRVRFGFFFLFALDELNDVRMVNVEDDHLGGAASLASGLDDTGEGVEAFHEAERAAGGAPAAETLGGGAQRREICSGAAAPLEEHAFGLGESEDGVE